MGIHIPPSLSHLYPCDGICTCLYLLPILELPLGCFCIAFPLASNRTRDVLDPFTKNYMTLLEDLNDEFLSIMKTSKNITILSFYETKPINFVRATLNCAAFLRGYLLTGL